MKPRRSLILLLSCFVIVSGCLLAFGADEKEKGTPEAPTNPKAVSGKYYRGDGTGYNIYLVLKENGKYTAEWHGCLGKYGEASGKWSLTNKCIALTSTKDDGMMKGHLKSLDVLKFKGNWIFVPSDDRDFYDKHGVSRYACFQKNDKK